MLNQQLFNHFYDTFNQELQIINNLCKDEKDDKKIKLLVLQSNTINLILTKLSIIKQNNDKIFA
jgi:hypothetical protein